MRSTLSPLFVAALIATAPNALAQTATTEAEAQALFERGRGLVEQKRYADACALFAASDARSPSGGALLNLADCYEKNAQTASAWAKFHELEDRGAAANRPDIVKLARARSKNLEERLSFLTIVVELRPEGLEVLRDGHPVPPTIWGVALPVDPGPHAIEARAPGKISWTSTVTIARPLSNTDVDVPVLTDAPVIAQATPAAPLPASPPVPEPPEKNGQRVLGLATAGVGTVGLGLGVVFGLVAKSKNDSANTLCPLPNQCTSATARDENVAARGDATASTIAFLAGGVLLAAGAVLFVTAPSTPRRSAALRIAPTLCGNQRGLVLGGAW